MIDIDKIEATAKASRDAAAPYHAPYLFASADIVLELIGLIRKQEAALSGAQASYGALAMELAAAKAEQTGVVEALKEISKYESKEGYIAMRALDADKEQA